jgi:hypothetical protein
MERYNVQLGERRQAKKKIGVYFIKIKKREKEAEKEGACTRHQELQSVEKRPATENFATTKGDG